MDSDLVFASGVEFDFEEGVVGAFFDCAVASYGEFTFCGVVGGVYFVF